MQELEGELAAAKKSLEQAQAEMRTLNQVRVGRGGPVHGRVLRCYVRGCSQACPGL